MHRDRGAIIPENCNEDMSREHREGTNTHNATLVKLKCAIT